MNKLERASENYDMFRYILDEMYDANYNYTTKRVFHLDLLGWHGLPRCVQRWLKTANIEYKGMDGEDGLFQVISFIESNRQLEKFKDSIWNAYEDVPEYQPYMLEDIKRTMIHATEVYFQFVKNKNSKRLDRLMNSTAQMEAFNEFIKNATC